MSKILKMLGVGATPLIDKAVEVADKFIDTPDEKKEFIKQAYEQEVKDRDAARELGKSKSTPDVLTYITLAIACGLGVAIFTDILDWSTLTEVQKGLITTFSGFFLRTLGEYTDTGLDPLWAQKAKLRT